MYIRILLTSLVLGVYCMAADDAPGDVTKKRGRSESVLSDASAVSRKKPKNQEETTPLDSSTLKFSQSQFHSILSENRLKEKTPFELIRELQIKSTSIEQRQKVSIEIALRVCQINDAGARYVLALAYYQNLLVVVPGNHYLSVELLSNRDSRINRALQLFHELADENYAYAEYSLYLHFSENKTGQFYEQKALDYLHRSVNHGCKEASLKLGEMYHKGYNGSLPNYEQAYYYFKQAADANYGKGFYRLSAMFYLGQYVAEDKDESIRLLRQAADLKDMDAMADFGSRLISGSRVSQDYSRGIEMLEAARRKGNNYASLNLASIYEKGIPDGLIVKDELRSFDLYLELARKGIAQAQYKVGYFFRKNIAPNWAIMGRNKDSLDCDLLETSPLDDLDSDGLFTSVRWCEHLGTQKALEWYQKSADQLYAPALFKLALMYRGGIVVCENQEEAARALLRKIPVETLVDLILSQE